MDIPVIKPTRIERITHPDGRVDVIIHVPKMVLDQMKKKQLEDKK
jgi:hypothetical protein